MEPSGQLQACNATAFNILPVGYQNAGHAWRLSDSSSAIKIVRAVSSLLSCTQRALYVGVDMLYRYACPRFAKCCIWIASEQLNEKKRDKSIHYTVLAAIRLFPEFISSSPSVWQSY
jgi:hypothetical protein